MLRVTFRSADWSFACDKQSNQLLLSDVGCRMWGGTAWRMRMSGHGAQQPSKPRGGYSRADHRARSHESAHTDEPLPPENTPDLPLVPKGPAPLLAGDAELRELID